MNPSFSAVLLISVCACAPTAPANTPAPPGPAPATSSAASTAPAPTPSAGAEPNSVAPSPAAGSKPALAPEIPSYIRDALAASDRDDRDRALDAGRKPAEMLAFFGIQPGMRVAEIAAGGGYTSELLARVVGKSGKVYAENPAFILNRFAREPWAERLKKPALANVVRADREFDDPLPPEATELDAVLSVLIYHDTVWQGANRDKMNQAIFRALKHGGVYGIVDHSAAAGSGLRDVQTYHRIDEKTLREEVEHAGFRLDAEADFLRNPADTRDWNDSPRAAGDRRGTSDRFVLKFVKP